MTGRRRGGRDPESALSPAVHARCVAVGEAICHNLMLKRDAWEDVLQDAFLAFCEKKWLFSRPDNEQVAWYSVVLRNKVVDEIRKRSRLHVITGDDVDMLRDYGIEDVEPQVLDSELRVALAQALADLTSSERDVVVLRIMQGLSVAEAAARRQTTSGSIKKLFHRGINRLRFLLRRQGFVE